MVTSATQVSAVPKYKATDSREKYNECVGKDVGSPMRGSMTNTVRRHGLTVVVLVAVVVLALWRKV